MSARLRYWVALAFTIGYSVIPVPVHTAFGMHVR